MDLASDLVCMQHFKLRTHLKKKANVLGNSLIYCETPFLTLFISHLSNALNPACSCMLARILFAVAPMHSHGSQHHNQPLKHPIRCIVSLRTLDLIQINLGLLWVEFCAKQLTTWYAGWSTCILQVTKVLELRTHACMYSRGVRIFNLKTVTDSPFALENVDLFAIR